MANPLDPYDRWGVNPLYMGPVGSTRVGGDTALTMPSADVSPVVGWYGQHAQTEAGRADAVRLAGNMLAFGPADVGAIKAFHGSPWFHGTDAAFDSFNTPEVYVTNNLGQAVQYAKGAHKPGTGSVGDPVVLKMKAKPGAVQNIDGHLLDAMDEGTDLQDAIDQAVASARRTGKTRYLEYSHPNAGEDGDHTVRISLYPHEDLFHDPTPLHED